MPLVRTIVTFVALGAASLAAIEAFNIKSTLQFRVKESQDCPNPNKYPYRLLGNKIRKYNRTIHTYSALLIFPGVVDDNFKVTARFATFGNGGWKDNYYVVSVGGLCTAFQTYAPGMWKIIKEKINQDCPIPAGNYSLNDIITTFDISWPPVNVHKTYRMTVEGYKMNKMVLCKIFLVEMNSRNTRA